METLSECCTARYFVTTVPADVPAPQSTRPSTATTLTAMLHFNDDVIKWKHFLSYWPFVRGIHLSPVNSPHKGQWRRALIFSLICAWINGWVNSREAGDLRRHSPHYNVTVMLYKHSLVIGGKHCCRVDHMTPFTMPTSGWRVYCVQLTRIYWDDACQFLVCTSFCGDVFSELSKMAYWISNCLPPISMRCKYFVDNLNLVKQPSKSTMMNN